MGAPYTSQSAPGTYNASPPADDGTESDANRLKWATIKTKLADALKTFSESINSENLLAFAKIIGGGGVTSTATNYTVQTSDQGNLVVATAAVTITTPAAATVGSPFVFAVVNDHSADITVDGNASETINGDASIKIGPSQGALLFTNGTNWFASGSVGAVGLGTITVFTTATDGTGAWTKPANLDHVLVHVIGGGGGGGNAVTTDEIGGGGGGGGYAFKKIAAADLGATEDVTVGAGGTGSAGSGLDGAAGGTSSFGSHCSATGGAGGVSSDTSPTYAAGGSGSNGDINMTGQRGGRASQSDATVGPYLGAGGAAAGPYGGVGTPMPAASDTEGLDGTDIFGGGGSGGYAGASNQNGGEGGDGTVIVFEYVRG